VALLARSCAAPKRRSLTPPSLLQHKSSKASFREVFWGTVLLNVSAFVVYHAVVKPSAQS
jgi:hypothetical protein